MAQDLPRDVFINAVFDEALRNRDLYFISADLGAQALDRFRAEAPGQFIHAGISEQNMIDVAAGMALNGKIVYVYAMAPFVTLRCYEQLKVAIASMGLPLTIIGVGAGFSYDDAGPTHYATEDVTCMRALAGIEIVTPGDTQAVLECARQTFRDPALRYVRLDRQHLPDVYPAGDTRFLRDGLVEIDRGSGMCLVANGYMLQKAREVRAALMEESVDLGIVDAYRVKPIDSTVLARVLGPYERVVTLEEHFLSGGLGSALLESMSDSGLQRPVKRFGIADRYYCENGGREYLHRLAGLDVPTVTQSVLAFAKRESCPATS